MSIEAYAQEMAQEWRKGAFCVSFPPKRHYATGTLHRPSCGTLHAVARAAAAEPSTVQGVTLERFRRSADSTHVGNRYRVCRRCCADIVVTGRNVDARPQAARQLTASVTMTREHLDAVLGQLGTPTTPWMKTLVAALRGAK